MLLAAAVLAATLALAVSAGAAVHDVTLVSRASGPSGAPANADSREGVAISNSGRFVAFVSEAQLAPAAVAGIANVYRRDTATRETSLISRADGSDGAGAGADSASPALSPGGRYVAFESAAANLSADDVDPVTDVFVRDTRTGATTLVSRADGPTGAGGDGGSHNPAISLYGDHVVFDSDADNLHPDANPAVRNVFLRDVKAQTVKLVSRGSPTLATPEGPPADGDSRNPSIAGNGDRIAFESDASNLSDLDADGVTDIFVRSQRFKSVGVISCPSSTFLNVCLPSGDDNSLDPAISLDGRYVAFESDAANLSSEDVDPQRDVFLRDLPANTTTFISRADGQTGAGGDGPSSDATVSGEGQAQFVAFRSSADNLSDQDAATFDVFVRDTANALITLASRAPGASGPGAGGSSFSPALAAGGRFVAFLSEADNLSSEDDDSVRSIFSRELSLTPPPVYVPPEQVCHHGDCTVPGEDTAHGAHDAGGAHAATGHTGHSSTEGGHAHDTKRPTQTLFAPRRQDVDKLYVMIQVHEGSDVEVTGSVSVPGSARLYRIKSVTRRIPIHGVRRIRLKLPAAAKRAVKRALRRGKAVRVRVKVTAVDSAGNRGIARRTIRLKP